MDRPLFLGDEVTAAGYRLAGLEVRHPDPGEAEAALKAARDEHPPLILLTAELAQTIPAAELDRLIAAARPPIQLVTDAAGRVAMPDLAARIQTRVGVGG
jgi:vacuolar-type H+-ATPase subunit F/Vma7